MCNRNNCHFQPHHLDIYRVFHRFGQAKFAYGGQVLGLSQLLLLPQLPEKTKLALKVVKINSKIIISRHESEYVTHSVDNNIIGYKFETQLCSFSQSSLHMMYAQINSLIAVQKILHVVNRLE